MSLAAAQTSAFFEDAAQMGIPNATVVQLQVEGIVSVDDLADFDKDTIEQIAANLRSCPVLRHRWSQRHRWKSPMDFGHEEFL
jgi:hypothetical protein